MDRHSMVREKELQLFKDINVLRSKTDPDSVYFVLNSATQKVNQIWVTNNKNVPKKVELSGVVSAQDLVSIQAGNQIHLSTTDGKLQVNPAVSPNSSLDIVSTSTQLQLQLSAGLLSQINSALQVGDNISELVNDVGYITNADLPNATSFKREEFEYTSGAQVFTLPTDYYQVFSVEVQGQGALSESQYNLILPNQVEILDTLNSGDYIVILYGEDLLTTDVPYYTQAQIDAILVDEDILYVGDITQYTDELAQDAIGSILTDTSTIDLTYNDTTPSISADVKPNSIDATHLSNTINVSEFVNDSNYATEAYVDSKIPADYSKVVYVNNVNPNSATIFDLENPPLVNDDLLKLEVNNLYIGTDVSTWVYNGTIYVTKTVTSATSNFFLAGTSTDAGNTKTASIKRMGRVGGGNAVDADDFITKSQHDTKQNTLTETNFGAFENSLTAKANPIDADSISIVDSADSNKAKKTTFTQLKAFFKTYYDTVYTTTGAVATQISTALSVYLTSSTASSTYETIANVANKVDKVTGKSLILDTEITRLATVTNYDNSSNVTALATKVDKVTGKSLIDDTEISRLATMTAIFTTALKTAYDSAVTWISTNGTNVISAYTWVTTNGATILSHLSNTSNPHSVTKAQVGLGNVDNTSDANKPLSTAETSALALKADLVAGLVPSSQLPSYVDDVIEGYLSAGIFYNEVGLTTTITGAVGKIYVNLTTGQSSKQYRWTGSAYLQITNGLIASTSDVPENVSFLYFTTARVLATLLTGISFVTGGAIVSTDSVLVAFGKIQKQITDALADIALKANIASPTFTGTPLAPTATAGTSTTQIATTAFVNASNAVTPINEGSGIGYVLVGRTAANYGNIGTGAFDVSFSSSASSTRGATGIYSFASGENNIASGTRSGVFGGGINTASLDNTVIVGGYGNNNSGSSAGMLGGVYSSVSGYAAASVGGDRLSAPSYVEVAMGSYPTTYTPTSTNTYSATDRALVVGNGVYAANSNAFVLLKNGLATLPSVTNALITAEATGKAVVTKEYLNSGYVAKGVDNTTTVVLSSATLNSTYPSATTGFRVYCASIIVGAMTYEKTPSGWLGFTCMVP